MWTRENELNAIMFCNAIRLLAMKPNNIDNLESYLSSHFDTWVKTYATNPESLAVELKEFAEMNLD